MKHDFEYKNFFSLLTLDNKKEQEFALKELIDNYLGHHFYVDDRTWFNQIIREGLINIVYHCERTIPYFSLYDDKNKAESSSNSGFLIAINSGNLEMIRYFMSHEDFPKFCKNEKIEEKIAISIDVYREYHSRRDSLDLNKYEQLIDILVEKFPWSIPPILAKVVLEQKNDEVTPVLKKFVQKYHPYLKNYLYDQEVENNLTRLCMVSLNHKCFEFAAFLKEQYPDIPMYGEYISFYLLYSHEPYVLQWMLSHPQFFELKSEHFNDLFDKCFNNILNAKVEKKDYEFFFLAKEAQLHNVQLEEMERAIIKNLTPFVKKYYKQFKEHFFDVSFYSENTCTKYINKKQKEKMYKDLLNRLPSKNISTKKLKI